MDLYEKIQVRSLVAVVGGSGSGKSSLVFAGLQPRLKAEGWLVEDCRPRNQPFYSLAEAFVRLLEPEAAGSQLVKQSSDLSELIQHRGMGEVVASLMHKYAGRSVLIIVDQFEELFALCEKEQREHFLKTLLDGLTKAIDLKLIVTLRADFCGQAYGDLTLTDAFQDAQLLVGPMDVAELQAAIEQPANLAEHKLEPGLIDRLLQDIGQDSGNLPLLEFALTQLWERREHGLLTHQAYTEIQGVKGALAQHAERAYARLSRDRQQQVPLLFTKLVRLGVGTEDTRKVATRSEVDNWELVTILANERLVATGRDDRKQVDTVEVIHEALIREWKRLRQWVDENREIQQLIQSVEDARQVWLSEKKRKFLLEGRLLKDAKRLLMQRLDVTTEVRSFIWESLWWRRYQLACVLIIPTAIVGLIIESYLRQEEIGRYQKLLGSDNHQERRYGIEGLIRGCPHQISLGFLSRYVSERLYGNCESLSGKNLAEIDLSNLNLANTNFSRANLSGTNISGADLSRANLSSANLEGASFEKAKLVGVNLSNTKFSGLNLSNVDISGANLSNADLNDAIFYSANFKNANLSNTNFGDVRITYAELSGANLENADLFGTNLSRTIGLTRQQWDKAKLCQTALPNQLISNKDCNTTINLMDKKEGRFVDYSKKDDAFGYPVSADFKREGYNKYSLRFGTTAASTIFFFDAGGKVYSLLACGYKCNISIGDVADVAATGECKIQENKNRRFDVECIAINSAGERHQEIVSNAVRE